MDNFGISKLDLKRRNRTQILKILRQYGPTSRIDISTELEITRAAITIITNEMVEQGIIYEKGEANYAGKKATRGRKKILIDIDSNYKFVFGVTVTCGFVSIGLTNLSGETLEKTVFPLDTAISFDELILKIVKTIEDIKHNNCLENNKILGMGVCVSTNHYETFNVKVNRFSPDFTALKASFEKLVEFPVTVCDLINALAQAEIDFNTIGVKPNNILFVRYSDDMDASIIINNKPYRGANNSVLDLSHYTVCSDENIPCECGKANCLHSFANKAAVLERIKGAYSKENTPNLYEATGGNVDNCGVVFNNTELLYADPAVREIAKKAHDTLITVINNTIVVLDPEQVVLIGKMFTNDNIAEYFKENIFMKSTSADKKPLYVSDFDIKTSYLGGCSVAIRELFVEKGGFEGK